MRICFRWSVHLSFIVWKIRTQYQDRKKCLMGEKEYKKAQLHCFTSYKVLTKLSFLFVISVFQRSCMNVKTVKDANKTHRNDGYCHPLWNHKGRSSKKINSFSNLFHIAFDKQKASFSAFPLLWISSTTWSGLYKIQEGKVYIKLFHYQSI